MDADGEGAVQTVADAAGAAADLAAASEADEADSVDLAAPARQAILKTCSAGEMPCATSSTPRSA